MKTLVVVVACAVLGGCVDVDPEWQLDHDRIVAVRTTPPHIQTGEVAVIDGLIAHKGSDPDVEMPVTAAPSPLAPANLAAALANVDGVWQVTGPGDDDLDAARATLGLDPGAPVPFEITMGFAPSNGLALNAQKIVWLGDSQDNPTLGAVTVDGAPPGDTITIGEDVDVPLTVDEDPTWMADWLTSCGTMHDDNEHAAFVHVLPTDQMKGRLVVVVRDTEGGVVWQVWPIEAQQ